MEPFDLDSFNAFFMECSGGRASYRYQCAVARALFEGHHLEVWAPTGAGKTLAVIAPFLYELRRSARPRWDRLIYVLPLRSLVESTAAEAMALVEQLGGPRVEVTVQTGERPDDPFFSNGRIIVTTYDQFLSGALHSPYGLPDKLHNVNAAAVAGALVAFDEYHLMEPDRAFLTATAYLNLFQPLCQSIWMTATATSALRRELAAALVAESLHVDDEELATIPAVATVERWITVESEPLTAPAVLEHHRERTIALVNTVERANKLYEALRQLAPNERVILLHSQFLPADRRRIETLARSTFGAGSRERCILVCTQVIEAGMNLSCQSLLTEVAPMNALVQRAGRCARFPGDSGEVRVYQLPEDQTQPHLPYRADEIAETLQVLDEHRRAKLTPLLLDQLVERVHSERDQRALREGFFKRQSDVLTLTRRTVVDRHTPVVSDLIRADDGQTIRAIIASDPGQLSPYDVEGFALRRWSLARLFDIAHDGPIGWRWSPEADVEWTPLREKGDLSNAFAVCLHPSVASYSPTSGLRLGVPGTFQSPPRERVGKHGAPHYRREPWVAHARSVGDQAAQLVAAAGAVLTEGFGHERWRLGLAELQATARAVGLVHDLGKLQVGWQRWAECAQRSLDPHYEHRQPLAHTDFDANDPADRARERELRRVAARPPHAAASAYYGIRALVSLISRVINPVPAPLLAAALAAILGHHGGWLAGTGSADLDLQPLVGDAAQCLNAAVGDAGPCSVDPVAPGRPTRCVLDDLLRPAAGADAWADWWPLVAFLTRVLRLADQRATSLFGREE